MDFVQNSSDQKPQCKEVQLKPVVKFKDGAASEDYRVLPLFEKKDIEERTMHRYSMLNNERMASRWRRRISGLGTGVARKTDKEFPDICDYHFKNCLTQFTPELSYKNFKDPHFHLTPGPGTDKYGQKPIPINMLLRKSENLSTKKPLRKKSGKPKKH